MSEISRILVKPGDAGSTYARAIASRRSTLGVEVLALFDGSFHDILSSKRPIQRAEDFKDLKIGSSLSPLGRSFVYSPDTSPGLHSYMTGLHSYMRAAGLQEENGFIADFFSRLGAQVIAVPESNLKEFAFDAVDSTLDDILNDGLYEKYRYLTRTHHSYSPYLLVANAKVLGALQTGTQKAILDAAEKAQARSLSMGDQVESLTLAKIIGRGVTLVPLAPEQQNRLYGATGLSYDLFGSEDVESFESLRGVLNVRTPSSGKYDVTPPFSCRTVLGELVCSSH